ncbi:MAG: PEP-CTERM sorting domain-containing protein [Planctomycetota bacterium]
MRKRHLLSVLALSAGVVVLSGTSASAATIGLEAELASEYIAGGSGVVWNIVNDADAFGGQAIQASAATFSQTDAPTANFNDIPFTEAGIYNLFVRLKTTGGPEAQLRVSPSFGAGPNTLLAGGGSIPATPTYSIIKVTGLVTTFGTGPEYTVTSGNLTPDFALGDRAGLQIIDAIAFSTQETLTEQEFEDSIIPEPASLALVGVGCMMLLSRRRQA